MVLFRYFNVGECSCISLKAQTSSSPHFSAGIVERAKGIPDIKPLVISFFFFLFLSCTLATSELFLGFTAAKFIVLEKNFCGDPSEFFSQVTNFLGPGNSHSC